MNIIGITLTEFSTALGFVALIGVGVTLIRRWRNGQHVPRTRTRAGSTD